MRQNLVTEITGEVLPRRAAWRWTKTVRAGRARQVLIVKGASMGDIRFSIENK
jgi:hypothetical protein